MSAPSAIWKRPPKARPWTAAITGTGRVRHSQAQCCGTLAMPWVRAVRSRAPGTPPRILVLVAVLHRREARHVEAGTERLALARQNPDSHALHPPELGAGVDNAL